MRIQHSRPMLGVEEDRAACRALASGHVARGAESEQFEAELATRLGVPHVRLTSSGTAALHAALLALGVEGGDEVIFPSYVCAAVLHAIRHCGAMPVPADIDAEGFGLSVESVRAAWSRRTRAIVVVHPFGRVLDLRPFREFDVPIVEDAAMALGGQGQEGPAGGQGTVGICSFYATKMITTGHGGCVATASEELHRRIVDLLEYDRCEDDRMRFNYSMSDLNAAVGRTQLARLDEFLRLRREIALVYAERLGPALFGAPVVPEDRSHVFHRYVLRIPAGKAALEARLNGLGIEAKGPVYRPAHRLLGLDDRAFESTAAADREALSLPIHPGMSREEATEVAGHTREGAQSA